MLIGSIFFQNSIKTDEPAALNFTMVLISVRLFPVTRIRCCYPNSISRIDPNKKENRQSISTSSVFPTLIFNNSAFQLIIDSQSQSIYLINTQTINSVVIIIFRFDTQSVLINIETYTVNS